jgi:hypothetical protein
VFDALGAGGDRLPDRSRRVRMNGYISAPIFGRLDRGAKLRFGELGDSIGLWGELTPPPAISLI